MFYCVDGTQQCLFICRKTWFYCGHCLMCFLSSPPFHLGIPKSGLWCRVSVLGDRCCGMWVLASNVSVHQSCHRLLTTLSPKLFPHAKFLKRDPVSFLKSLVPVPSDRLPSPPTPSPTSTLGLFPVPHIGPQAWSGLFLVTVGYVGLQTFLSFALPISFQGWGCHSL